MRDSHLQLGSCIYSLHPLGSKITESLLFDEGADLGLRQADLFRGRRGGGSGL